jgi:hypothetical protein
MSVPVYFRLGHRLYYIGRVGSGGSGTEDSGPSIPRQWLEIFHIEPRDITTTVSRIEDKLQFELRPMAGATEQCI